MTATCEAPRCKALGLHRHECGIERCSGCAPWPAAYGLRLCYRHRDYLAKDALRAAEVYDALAAQLAPAGGGLGEVTSGTRDRGLKLNPSAVDARETVRRVLQAWARLIVDERGIVGPTVDDVHAVARFVAHRRNIDWLAAHEAAGDCADELYEISHGAPWRIAYPSGTRTLKLRQCTSPGCAGTAQAVLRQAGSLLPTEIVCDADPAHRWPVERWLALADMAMS